jgi:hypothetical protein
MHVYGNGIPQPKFHFEFIVDADDCRVQKNNSFKINYRGLTFFARRNEDLVNRYQDLSLLGRNLKVEIIGRSQINE